MLFPLLDSQITGSGEAVSIDDDAKVPQILQEELEMDSEDSQMKILENTIKFFASQAYRTILVSYRDMSMDEYESIKAANNDFETEADREVLEDKLTALCVWGLQDPLRPTIIASVKQCRSAGITVIMCTGDNIDTATAISINAGIVTKEEALVEHTCMTGADFREMVGPIQKTTDKDGNEIDQVTNLNKFKQIKKNLRVMARSSPDDKYLLVTGIQQCDGVVAVTGDGSNDAPALTKADVGFSMGITGTDIAKGACDIILLDDNFASIVVALKYGRCVYDNVRKFLQFQLTINIVALYICFVSSAILRDSPLNAVEMLWINLIMDTFGACALASEPPAFDILERQPYKKNNPIITAVMWRNILGHAVFQMIMVSLLIFAGSGNLTYAYQTKCFSFDPTDSTKCIEWNPFFADGLYQTTATVTWWTDLNLTKSDFNETAMNNFICEHKEQTTHTTVECTAEIYEDSDNFILPQDIPVGYMTQRLLHYTIIFQAFVFLQLWNQFNARHINEFDYNPFKLFFSNITFLVIILFAGIVQLVMVQIGGTAVKAFPLSTNHQIISVAFGALSIVNGIIVKFVPLKWFEGIKVDDSPATEEQLEKKLTNTLKKSSTLRQRQNTKKVTDE